MIKSRQRKTNLFIYYYYGATGLFKKTSENVRHSDILCKEKNLIKLITTNFTYRKYGLKLMMRTYTSYLIYTSLIILYIPNFNVYFNQFSDANETFLKCCMINIIL